MKCVLCGSELPHDGLQLVMDRGVVVRDGKVALLTPTQTVIFNTLLKARPRVVSMDSVVRAVYAGSEAPLSADRIVRTLISQMRRELQRINLVIADGRVGRGYCLEYVGAASVLEMV